jgi:hypothetical protein
MGDMVVVGTFIALGVGIPAGFVAQRIDLSGKDSNFI